MPSCSSGTRTSAIGADPRREAGARELGPVIVADDSGLWDTDRICTDAEWLAFGRSLQERIGDRLRLAVALLCGSDRLLPRHEIRERNSLTGTDFRS
jgi:hypothetical protein